VHWVAVPKALRARRVNRREEMAARRLVSMGGHRVTSLAVSLKRLLDESPWLQFTSECQRF
jgi:hypothetical protein